jgi:hypothetical protein
MANVLSFKLGRRDVKKSVTVGDSFYIDDSGRQFIFRNHEGGFSPVMVGFDEFTEWLSNNKVKISPEDRDKLSELNDKISELEDYENMGDKNIDSEIDKIRDEYLKIALPYYSGALGNQAKNLNTTPEELHITNQNFVDSQDDFFIKRKSLKDRGWSSSILAWVDNHDRVNGVTPDDDSWYYNRILAIIALQVIPVAMRGEKLSRLDLNDMFSESKINDEVLSNYKLFFTGNFDSSKVRKAIKKIKRVYNQDDEKRAEMSEFVEHWYDRVSKDFDKANAEVLPSSPVTSLIRKFSGKKIPDSLPKLYGPDERKALMRLYLDSKSPKNHSAHMVLLHALSRIINSLPNNVRLSSALSIADGDGSLNSIHREAYNRCFVDHNKFGLNYDPDDLVSSGLSHAEKCINGDFNKKLNGLKRISMVLGTIDGRSFLESNPSVDDRGFGDGWFSCASNAGRQHVDGPGLSDLLLDDDFRSSSIYGNNLLRIIHDPEEENDQEEDNFDLGDGFAFSSSRMLSPSGHYAKFSPTTHGYANISVFSPDGATRDSRVYMPPVPLVDMDEGERSSYLSHVKNEFKKMIEPLSGVNGSPDENFSAQKTPLINFPNDLDDNDSGFVNELNSHLYDNNFKVDQMSRGIYRITNPASSKIFDLLYNPQRKSLIGAFKPSEPGGIKFLSRLSMKDFLASI